MTPAQVKVLLQKTSDAIEKMVSELDATENGEDSLALHALATQARKLCDKATDLQTHYQERAEQSSEIADTIEGLVTQLSDLETELVRFSDEDEGENEEEEEEEEEESPPSSSEG